MSGYYVLSNTWLTSDSNSIDLDIENPKPIDPLVVRQLCLMAAALDPEVDDMDRFRQVLQRHTAEDDLGVITLGLLDKVTNRRGDGMTVVEDHQGDD
jgi:hypothetical protein